MKDAHHQALERMYLLAPINRLYLPAIDVTEVGATISIMVSEKFHHAVGAVHGSVYFKMLDDAAYFAAAANERGHFIFTLSFQTYLLRPVVSGVIRCNGRLVKRTRTHFFAESVLFDSNDEEIGRGSGVFVLGKQALSDADGYKMQSSPGRELVS